VPHVSRRLDDRGCALGDPYGWPCTRLVRAVASRMPSAQGRSTALLACLRAANMAVTWAVLGSKAHNIEPHCSPRENVGTAAAGASSGLEVHYGCTDRHFTSSCTSRSVLATTVWSKYGKFVVTFRAGLPVSCVLPSRPLPPSRVPCLRPVFFNTTTDWPRVLSSVSRRGSGCLAANPRC